MTNKEMQEHFEKMVTDHALDTEDRIRGAMDKIDGLEVAFNAKFDDVNTTLAGLSSKFDRLLGQLQPPRIPPPVLQGNTVPRAGRVLQEDPQGSVASAAAHAAHPDDHGAGYAADAEYLPGRPHAHPSNLAHRQQAQVLEDDHVAKLKLIIPPFEGRYNPDAYLTWELEVEQRFACLQYPEDRRVCAATCEFTGFASVWWSEYCRLNHDNISNTWDNLKRFMRTRFLPPYYQREMLQKLTRL